MSGFQTYGVCPCGHREYVPHGNLFFAPKVCPACGIEPTSYVIGCRWRDPVWRLEVARWVSTARLFRPSTWGAGFWQTREEYADASVPNQNPASQ